MQVLVEAIESHMVKGFTERISLVSQRFHILSETSDH